VVGLGHMSGVSGIRQRGFSSRHFGRGVHVGEGVGTLSRRHTKVVCGQSCIPGWGQGPNSTFFISWISPGGQLHTCESTAD